jgi:hypothetical protein
VGAAKLWLGDISKNQLQQRLGAKAMVPQLVQDAKAEGIPLTSAKLAIKLIQARRHDWGTP